MKYMIIRLKDERSSDICAEIEDKAIREGGLSFPFTINGRRYDSDVLEKGLMSTGAYYTHLFHENCRSSIVPIGEAANVVMPGKQLDEIDRTMLVDGAMAESATMQMAESGEVSSKGVLAFVSQKVKLRVKQIMNFVFRRAR